MSKLAVQELISTFKGAFMGDEEMTQCLRVHAAPAEDMSSVPDILSGLLTNTHNWLQTA